jgi:hypothetical protein
VECLEARQLLSGVPIISFSYYVSTNGGTSYSSVKNNTITIAQGASDLIQIDALVTNDANTTTYAAVAQPKNLGLASFGFGFTDSNAAFASLKPGHITIPSVYDLATATGTSDGSGGIKDVSISGAFLAEAYPPTTAASATALGYAGGTAAPVMSGLTLNGSAAGTSVFSSLVAAINYVVVSDPGDASTPPSYANAITGYTSGDSAANDALLGPLTVVVTGKAQATITTTAAGAQSATTAVSKSFSLGSFSQSNATGPYTVEVSWGDGTADTKFTQTFAGTITAQSHTFAKAATDAVGVTVTDSAGHTSNKATFNVVVAGAPSTKLVIAKQPAETTVAGKAISPGVVIDVENASGQIVTTDNSAVILSLATSPSGATESGTFSVKAVNGVATFSNLILTKAGAYTLKATDGALTSATTSALSITAAAVAKVAFAVQPKTTTAGAAVSPAVVVDIEDTYGNIVTTSAATVAMAVASGGGTLTGMTSVAAKSGVATFSNLIMTLAGAHTIKVTEGSLTATSGSFTISPAAASKLVLATAPGATTAGKAISPAVVVDIEDAYGNIVTTNTSSVTISLAGSPVGATLTGTTTVAAKAGVAAFSNLVLTKAGSYTTKAADGSLTAVTSTAFTVAAATASKVIFTTSPTSGSVNTALSAIAVSVEDAFGNIVTTDKSTVTISVSSGVSGAALSGTLAVAASSGVAKFSTLKLSKSGSYTLKAVDGSLTSAVSMAIKIT